MPEARREVTVDSYDAWPRRELELQVRELRADTRPIFDFIIGKKRTNADTDRLIAFLQSHYEALMHTKGPFSICTVYEFESTVGPIRGLQTLDAPPYAEVLMQGFRGLAFRHPEYMLARDVEFLYDAFWQAEKLVSATVRQHLQPAWMNSAVENVQALGRATILACFSLIESFVSGLSQSYLLVHAGLDETVRKKLQNNHGPLLERLMTVPRLIGSGPMPLHSDEPPISRLFGEIKQHRDAFVHCEPGSHESRAGFVKQDRFHAVSPEIVDDSVCLTAQIIRATWRHVYQRDGGPAWLRNLGQRDKYSRGLEFVPSQSCK